MHRLPWTRGAPALCQWSRSAPGVGSRPRICLAAARQPEALGRHGPTKTQGLPTWIPSDAVSPASTDEVLPARTPPESRGERSAPGPKGAQAWLHPGAERHRPRGGDHGIGRGDAGGNGLNHRGIARLCGRDGGQGRDARAHRPCRREAGPYWWGITATGALAWWSTACVTGPMRAPSGVRRMWRPTTTSEASRAASTR